MNSQLHKILIYVTLLSTTFLVGGCGITGWPPVHKIEIDQGNVISQSSVNQLRPGMTKSQVRYVMGSPMLVDPFHEDRWDYIFWLKPGYGDPEEKRMTLHFQYDQLARIEGDFQPEPEGEFGPAQPDKTLVVPIEREGKGVFRQVLETFGLGRD